MIYTCTLNPSVDYVIHLDGFKEGQLNRGFNETYFPGGKGINVSLLLSHLGIKSTLYGFLGGFTGNFIEEKLKQSQLLVLNFTKVDENSRINIKIKGKSESEINANGPLINEESYGDLINKVNQIKKDDVFILSGSVPGSITRDIYQEIANIVNKKRAMLVVDASKDKLLTTLKAHPFLIKPNKHELEEVFDVVMKDLDDLIYYANKLIEKGAQNVLVSLGNEGALLVCKEGVFVSNTPDQEVVNSVGAGDSMVAGFMAKYLETKSFVEALKFGSMCGSATAYSSGLATKEAIMNLENQIEVKKIKD